MLKANGDLNPQGDGRSEREVGTAIPEPDLANGNLTAAGNRTSVNGNTLSFNGENQVVSVNDPSIGGTETIAYL